MCLVSLVEVDGARKVKPELRNGFVELKKVVGEGKETSFWCESWVESEVLEVRYR